MYWVERKRHNTLAEYAFYKNYFDRFTAVLAFFYNYDPTKKKTIKDFTKNRHLRHSLKE